MSQTTDRPGPARGPDGDTDAPTVVLRRPMIAPWPVSQPAPAAPAGSSVPRALPSWSPQSPPVAGASSSRRGPGIVIGVVAAVVVVLALIGLAVNRTTDVGGSVTIRGMSGLVAVGQSCVPISSATQRTVSLFAGSGELVGVVDLPSSGIAVSTGTYGSTGYADACRYSFTLSDVRLSEDFYRVSAGADSSTGVSFTRDALVRDGANIVLGG